MSTFRTELRRRAGGQDGFMLIEVLAATLVIAVGIVGLLSGFVASQKLSLVSERESTMSHVAQREIERIEGLAYSSIGLTALPATSAVAQNPGTYVTQTGTTTGTFNWSRGASPVENLDVDPPPPSGTGSGAVTPSSQWTEGSLSGTVYDYITWANDGNCGANCPSSQNYKRITVVVTMSGSMSSSPVWISSVIADPNAAPANNGAPVVLNGNPLSSGATTCASVSGTVTTTVPCESSIDSGTANTFFLHDCVAGSGACTPPTVSNALDQMDEMNLNPPPAPATTTTTTTTTTTSLPTYSLGSSGQPPGGRVLEPLCGSSAICGTGQTSDCTSGLSNLASLLNVQNELWVTAPLASSTTLTGEGALNLFTQTESGPSAVVTLCIELYDIPPTAFVTGTLAGALGDIGLTGIGGADLGGFAYVPPTSGGTNWPTTPSNVEFAFKYAAPGEVVPQGDRVGIRVWMEANVSNAIDLLYDNPNDPSEIQLNATGTITTSGS